jgi:[glutamine synthetase] adenylyltransferase / [glutamine synthetase]-adenylyl-L-tyrosine phosphorylase
VLRKAVRRDDLKEEVRKMRERMRENLSKARPGQFDMKQDAGGVADLEFLVQFWMLQWADRYPEIVTFSDNIRQLESLGRAIWCRRRGWISWSTPTASTASACTG